MLAQGATCFFGRGDFVLALAETVLLVFELFSDFLTGVFGDGQGLLVLGDVGSQGCGTFFQRGERGFLDRAASSDVLQACEAVLVARLHGLELALGLGEPSLETVYSSRQLLRPGGEGGDFRGDLIALLGDLAELLDLFRMLGLGITHRGGDFSQASQWGIDSHGNMKFPAVFEHEGELGHGSRKASGETGTSP